MSRTPWINDPVGWREMPLPDKLEMLRLHYCTGPCGQSQSVLATRSATDAALREAIKRIQWPSTLDISKAASLWYPIMLAQEAGEISESKAAEMLGVNIEEYREAKLKAISCVDEIVKTLPSPILEMLRIRGKA